jgi:hypothetical protein
MDMAVFPVFSTFKPGRSSMRWCPNYGQATRGKNSGFKSDAERKSRHTVPWHRGAQNFWQAGWANIWNAVLAVRWPSPVEFPLAQRGPVPEVLLSRLPRKKRILP